MKKIRSVEFFLNVAYRADDESVIFRFIRNLINIYSNSLYIGGFFKNYFREELSNIEGRK